MMMHGLANFKFKDNNSLNLCANHQTINIAYKFSTLAVSSNTVNNDSDTYITVNHMEMAVDGTLGI
jgi:hypothetical protein